MDFPLFFLDIVGNRMLIALVAVVHVFINHPLAVGAYPLVALMEWRAWRTGNQAEDQLAYKVTFVLFIITTSLGAMTGVGIWLTTALIAPFGIGSLIRVFFWGWFSEWIVFVSEVVLILIYFLTWKSWREGGMKKLHIGLGAFLAVFSWFTMGIIVGILGYMMNTGAWLENHDFFSGFFNPIYLPQLAFRTIYAMGVAGLCVWFLIFFFTKKNTELRQKSVRFVSSWILVWVVPFFAACWWYWKVVPGTMAANLDIALLTQKFQSWHETLFLIMAATLIAIIITAAIGVIRSKWIPGVALLIPFVLGLWLLGHFERVREFIRKPYVIGGYMYSNGIKVDELPVFQRDGVLPYAVYVKHHQVTSENTVEAGRDVFIIACSRCHTTRGINSMVTKFTDLYGTDPWDPVPMKAFISTMHTTRTFMPPFPGNDKEAEALVEYLKTLQTDPEYIFDAPVEWSTGPVRDTSSGQP